MTRCAYCHHALADSPVEYCPTCNTPHHEECWRENEGCAVPMCESGPKVPYIAPAGAPAGTRERVTVSLGDEASQGELARQRRRRRTVRAGLTGLALLLVVVGLLVFLFATQGGS